MPTLLAVLVALDLAASAPRLDLVFRDDTLHRFTAAERQVIDSIATATLAEVAALLPGLPAQVTLTVEPSTSVIDVTGEGGVTPSPGNVTWAVDPSRPGGVAAIARAALRHTLFHELHHLARGWTVRGGRPLSGIMDAVIAEGLATHFAREYGGHRAPWAEAPADVERWVAELRALPPSALRDYLQWMMQHPDGRRWIGYRAGTWIVDRAVQRSGRSSIALAAAPAAEVIALAGLDTP